VEIGKDVSVSELQNNYDAVILAFGADQDKSLGIEGDSLKGIYSARNFVEWYNGLPSQRLVYTKFIVINFPSEIYKLIWTMKWFLLLVKEMLRWTLQEFY
jgi:hypothetical protein